jgi:hypothetical protein
MDFPCFEFGKFDFKVKKDFCLLATFLQTVQSMVKLHKCAGWPGSFMGIKAFNFLF